MKRKFGKRSVFVIVAFFKIRDSREIRPGYRRTPLMLFQTI
jgi:hypothetical protein